MPSEPELPRLSSADLAERFRGDEPALRRYRILAALLREGRAPAEVARTFGVSRESVRRLRHTFTQGGLAALRSRRRGGGHMVRGTPLARAITQELAADPGLAAAELWRRVQLRLAEQGVSAPRSTFYRLLARVRDDDTSASHTSATARLLREALVALPEDPPITLGRSALAELLIPGDADTIARGQRLQSALRTAIGRLRPADEAGPVLSDPRWRHYLVLAGEYEAGEQRADLQEALALSTSTYSRAKREALERLVALLPAAVAELPPPPPPATLYSAPAASPGDYEQELELYVAVLRRDGLALLWGDATVAGELAAALAARLQARGQRVIWHAAREPDVEPRPGLRLLQTLAAALAAEGERELWDELSPADATPLVWHLDLLANLIGGRRWAVVIANTHWLTDGDAQQALEVLTTAREQRELRLALAGAALPAWADAERWPPLVAAPDAATIQEFQHRLTRRAFAPQHPAPPDVLRERVAQLVAALPPDTTGELPTDERAQLLEALAPLERLLADLRRRSR